MDTNNASNVDNANPPSQKALAAATCLFGLIGLLFSLPLLASRADWVFVPAATFAAVAAVVFLVSAIQYAFLWGRARRGRGQTRAEETVIVGERVRFTKLEPGYR